VVVFKALANFQCDRLLQTDIISKVYLEGINWLSASGAIVLVASGCKPHVRWVFAKIDTDKICSKV
jgi:hypothetical protein